VITKRCAVCSRIRAYESDDQFCIVCGSEALEAACACGRGYEYALHEAGDLLHCPRCGKRLRGRDDEFE
jgi:hypothetical protein